MARRRPGIDDINRFLPGSVSTAISPAYVGPPPESFPVGSVFISAVSTNPATLLGYGTWSSLGEGRVLVGVDTSDPDFDTVLETGGSKVHYHA